MVISIIPGVMIGCMITLLFKYCESVRHNFLGVNLIILLSGYASFISCEFLELSGPVSAIAAANMIRNYARFNLKEEVYQFSITIQKFLSYTFENFIYFYLGLNLQILYLKTETINLPLIFFLFGMIILVRFFVISISLYLD